MWPYLVAAIRRLGRGCRRWRTGDSRGRARRCRVWDRRRGGLVRECRRARACSARNGCRSGSGGRRYRDGRCRRLSGRRGNGGSEGSRGGDDFTLRTDVDLYIRWADDDISSECRQEDSDHDPSGYPHSLRSSIFGRVRKARHESVSTFTSEAIMPASRRAMEIRPRRVRPISYCLPGSVLATTRISN